MAESETRTQGWVHCILYVLFENAMGVVKLWAVVAGAHTHVISQKFGACAPWCKHTVTPLQAM